MNLAHGTATAYGRGCRCDACREANTLRGRAYRDMRAARLAAETTGRPVPDMAWAEDAACRGRNPDLWFPAGGHGVGVDYSAARRICAGCPVAADCLEHALAVPEQGGMWGGLDPDERRLLRRRRRYAERKVTA